MKRNPAETYGSKLYNPRNLEGEPNAEVLETLRNLENALKEHPAFVGLQPVGSTMKGYSDMNNPESDIDVIVLFDAETDANIQVYNELKKIADEFFLKTKFKSAPIIQNINRGRLKAYVDNPDIEGRMLYLSRIFYVTTGKSINSYRDFIVDYINSLPQAEKEKTIGMLVSAIQGLSRVSHSHKARKRFKAEPEAIDTALEARDQLWEKRIRKFFEERPKK